jgi:hypothetical protein
MGREGERWRSVVEEHFGFLAASGFTRTTVDDGNWWETSVIYMADSVALKVAASREYNRVGVELVRLVDSAVPEYPVWVTDAPLDWMLLDNVVEARRPDLLGGLAADKGLSKKAVSRQLALAASLLREIAPDFVSGDTRAIDDGAEVVRARVRENRQQLTVHLPAIATDEQVAAAGVDAAAWVPPEVQVHVRRYQGRRIGRRRRGDDELDA